MARSKIIFLCMMAMLFATGCSDNGSMMPKSSSRPYEVLLRGDVDSILYRLLTSEATGFPQVEPQFDVYPVHGNELSNTEQMARNIVTVTINSTLAKASIRYEKNVYAHPQTIVHITLPSKKNLADFIKNNGSNIIENLLHSEMTIEANNLQKHHNAQAEKKIKQMFHLNMKIPSDMQSSKYGKNFIWLSNNADAGMQNICIYRVEKSSALTEKGLRDSIMKSNIPGEQEGMYMETATMQRKGNTLRGLWDMHGDEMGGPYVIHIIDRGSHLIYAEAFVYAPEMKKRNLIRKTEAALYTIKASNKR